jgi:hypothetical protein
MTIAENKENDDEDHKKARQQQSEPKKPYQIAANIN